jgi:hypothetical protein
VRFGDQLARGVARKDDSAVLLEQPSNPLVIMHAAVNEFDVAVWVKTG